MLTAIGDSVTSAHIQNGFGDDCANTLADRRGLKGNEAMMSYAGLYAGAKAGLVSYYNVARTGFSTRELVGATAAHPDACRNPWQRAFPPVALAAAVVKEAKHAGDTAFVVGTAGANNTNWATVIAQAFSCRAAKHAVDKTGVGTFEWTEGTVPARLIPDGGGCLTSALVFGDIQHYAVTVPAYNGGQQYAGLTADVRSITDAVLRAGADKVVWVKYHDITPAKVDVKLYLNAVLKNLLPKTIRDKLPDLASQHDWLIDPVYAQSVRSMIGEVNAAVGAGLPGGPRVVHVDSAIVAGDLQDTMVGGAPHPNGTGHAHLAARLKTVLDG